MLFFISHPIPCFSKTGNELIGILSKTFDIEIEQDFLCLYPTPRAAKVALSPTLWDSFLQSLHATGETLVQSAHSIRPYLVVLLEIALVGILYLSVADTIMKEDVVDWLSNGTFFTTTMCVLLSMHILFSGFSAATKKQTPPNRPEAYLAATGVGFLGNSVTTDTIQNTIDNSHKSMKQTPEMIDFWNKMIQNTGIRTRHLGLPCYHIEKDSESGFQDVTKEVQAKEPHSLSRSERAEIWWDVASQVAVKAARAALEDWASKSPSHRGCAQDITHGE